MFKFIKNRIKEVYECRMRGHNYIIIGQKTYSNMFGLFKVKVNVLVCLDCGISKEDSI